MSSSNSCILTCIQISQEASQVVWYFHILQNFPQFVVIHTVKGFGVVNKAEVDVFMELSCFLYDPTAVVNLISGSSAFSKSSLSIWNFMVHILLKPDLENCEHYFASVWDEYNCVVVWAFFLIAFLWDWASLVAQRVKCLPAMQETWVQSLSQEDPLERETATHSGTLAWKITWIEKPVGYSLWVHKESDVTEWLHFHFSLGVEWKLTSSSPVATAEFSKFAGILNVALSQHHLSGFEIAQLEFHHLH